MVLPVDPIPGDPTAILYIALMVIADLLQWTAFADFENQIDTLFGVIPHHLADDFQWPIPQLTQYFSGVPKPEKTIEAGYRLLASRVPMVRALGMHLIYGATEHGYVLSSQPNAELWINPAVRLTLMRLGIQDHAPLRASLEAIMSQGEYAEQFDNHYRSQDWGYPKVIDRGQFHLRFQESDWPEQFHHATKWFGHQHYVEIPPQGIKPPPPPPPPPPPTHPQPPGICTDPCQLALIEAVQTIAALLAQHQPGTGPPGGGLTEQDLIAALSAWCQSCITPQIGTPLTAIVNQVTNLIKLYSTGSGQEVNATQNVAKAILAISQQIPALINAMPDFELERIVRVLGPGLIDIANSIDNLGNAAPDLTEINAWAKMSREHISTPQGLIDEWQKRGAITPGQAQIISSGSWPWDLSNALNQLVTMLGGLEGDIESGIGKVFVNLIEPVAGLIWSFLQKITVFIDSQTGRVWEVIKSIVRKWNAKVVADAGPGAGPFKLVAVGFEDFLLVITEEGFGSVAEFFVGLVTTPMLTAGLATPDNYGERAKIAYGDAFSAGLAAHLIATGLDALYLSKQTGLIQLAAVMGDLAGFAEIAKAQIGPVLRTAVSVPAQYDAQRKTRPYLPNGGIAHALYARRKISQAQWKKLVALNGFAPEFENPQLAAAYTPVAPRMLAAMIGETNYDHAQIVEVLQDAGIRDDHIDVVLTALEAKGLQPLRNAIITDTVAEAANGLLADAQIDSTFTQLDLTDHAKSLLKQHIAIKRAGNLAKEIRLEYTAAAKGGLMTIPQFESALTSLGYQDPEVKAYSATVQVYLDVEVVKEQQRAAAAESRAAKNAAAAASIESYKKGDSNALILATKLTAIGFSPAHTAAATALAAVQVEPTVKRGANETPFYRAQQTKKANQTEYEAAFKKGQITESQFRSYMAALGFAKPFIDARAAYLIAVASKKQPLQRAP